MIVRCFLVSFWLGTSLSLFAQPQEEELPAPDTMTVAYYETPPFVMQEETGELTGVLPWLLGRIIADQEVVCLFRRMPLDSALHSLKRGEVDITLAPLTITSERSETIDFSVPFFVAHSTLLMNETSSVKKGLSFLKSFISIQFWQALGALFLILFVFGSLTWLFERRVNREEFPPGIKGLWSGLWWSAVTMTTVGYGDKSPRSIGGRVVALIWMFTAIILISGFTAGIASSLTVTQLSWNQDEINAFKDTPLATVKESATDRWLMRHFFTRIKGYHTLDEAIVAMERGQVEAVAHDQPVLRYIRDKSDMQQFDINEEVNYNPQLYAIGFSEALSTERKEALNTRLLQVLEGNDWWPKLAEYGLVSDQ